MLKLAQIAAIYTCLSTLTFSIDCHASGVNTMLFGISKPIFNIKIENSNCMGKVRINDIPLLEDIPADIAGTVSIPINEWIAPGKNTLTVQVEPLKEGAYARSQQCKVTVSLSVKEADTRGRDQTNSKIITNIAYTSEPTDITYLPNRLSNFPANDLDQNDNFNLSKINHNSIEGEYGQALLLQQTITLPNTLPAWKWISSETIPNNEHTKKSLVKEYQKIWDAIKNDQLNNLKSLFTERQEEYQQAYYNESSADLHQSILDDAKNPALELGDFDPKYEHLQVFANGKLAELTIWDGSGALFFNYKDDDASNSYTLIFRRQNGEWILTR